MKLKKNKPQTQPKILKRNTKIFSPPGCHGCGSCRENGWDRNFDTCKCEEGEDKLPPALEAALRERLEVAEAASL